MKSMPVALSVAIVCVASVLRAATAVIPSPANDVAPQGIGFSSSVGFGGIPSHLNDGDRDGNYSGPNSIAHSSGAAVGNYMGIHFSGIAPIDQVNIFNRTDGGFGTRIDGNGTVPFTLDIYSGGTNVDNGLDGTLVYTHDYLFNPTISITAVGGDTASGMVIDLPNVVVGDTVEVIQNNNDYMNLAEIEVFTTPEPSSLVAFAGLAAMGLIVVRRRRQAKA